HWEVRDFRGEHKGGLITARGGSFPDKDMERVVLQVEGKHVELDAELEQELLNPDVRGCYTMFEPKGKLDFACTVSFDIHKPGVDGGIDTVREPVPDVDITLWPQKCTIKPGFF